MDKGDEHDNPVAVCVMRMESVPVFGFGIDTHPFACSYDLPAAHQAVEAFASTIPRVHHEALWAAWARACARARARWAWQRQKFCVASGDVCVVRGFLGTHIGVAYIDGWDKLTTPWSPYVVHWPFGESVPKVMTESAHGGLDFCIFDHCVLGMVERPPVSSHALMEACDQRGEMVSTLRGVYRRERGTPGCCRVGRGWQTAQYIVYEHPDGWRVRVKFKDNFQGIFSGAACIDRINISCAGKRGSVVVRENRRGWRLEREAGNDKRLKSVEDVAVAFERIHHFLEDMKPDIYGQRCDEDRNDFMNLLEGAVENARGRAAVVAHARRHKVVRAKHLSFEPKTLGVGQLLCDERKMRFGQVNVGGRFLGLGNTFLHKRLTRKALADFQIADEGDLVAHKARLFPFSDGAFERTVLGVRALMVARDLGSFGAPYDWHTPVCVGQDGKISMRVYGQPDWVGATFVMSDGGRFRQISHDTPAMSFGIGVFEGRVEMVADCDQPLVGDIINAVFRSHDPGVKAACSVFEKFCGRSLSAFGSVLV